MMFLACSFCENTSKNCTKVILKLSRFMLEKIGAQKGADYWSCTDHLLGGEASVKHGKRKRWRPDAEFLTEDIECDGKYEA